MENSIQKIGNLIRNNQSPSQKAIALVFLELINSSEKFFPTWHPLGFIHLTLLETSNGTVRLHIWPPFNRRPKSPNWQIHSHIYNLNSLIICGKITNTFYETSDLGVDDLYREYKVIYGQGLSRLEGTSNMVNVNILRTDKHLMGDIYSIPSQIFHSSSTEISELSATIVATSKHIKSSPLVLGDSVVHRELIFERTACDENHYKTYLKNILQNFKSICA